MTYWLFIRRSLQHNTSFGFTRQQSVLFNCMKTGSNLISELKSHFRFLVPPTVLVRAPVPRLKSLLSFHPFFATAPHGRPARRAFSPSLLWCEWRPVCGWPSVPINSKRKLSPHIRHLSRSGFCRFQDAIRRMSDDALSDLGWLILWPRRQKFPRYVMWLVIRTTLTTAMSHVTEIPISSWYDWARYSRLLMTCYDSPLEQCVIRDEKEAIRFHERMISSALSPATRASSATWWYAHVYASSYPHERAVVAHVVKPSRSLEGSTQETIFFLEGSITPQTSWERLAIGSTRARRKFRWCHDRRDLPSGCAPAKSTATRSIKVKMMSVETNI